MNARSALLSILLAGLLATPVTAQKAPEVPASIRAAIAARIERTRTELMAQLTRIERTMKANPKVLQSARQAVMDQLKKLEEALLADAARLSKAPGPRRIQPALDPPKAKTVPLAGLAKQLSALVTTARSAAILRKLPRHLLVFTRPEPIALGPGVVYRQPPGRYLVVEYAPRTAEVPGTPAKLIGVANALPTGTEFDRRLPNLVVTFLPDGTLRLGGRFDTAADFSRDGPPRTPLPQFYDLPIHLPGGALLLDFVAKSGTVRMKRYAR